VSEPSSPCRHHHQARNRTLSIGMALSKGFIPHSIAAAKYRHAGISANSRWRPPSRILVPTGTDGGVKR